MRGIKANDIVKHRDGYHAYALRPSEDVPRAWEVMPLESWARTRRLMRSRDVVGIYRPLKRSA